MNPDAASSKAEFSRRSRWFLRGARSSFSVPGLILASAFVGFAGLARGAGLTLSETLFMIAVVWALPGKVVLVGAVLSGASLPAAALAVSLSSVRLMPMVVALVPEMRAPRTPEWVLYALSHFVAVTSWVLAMEQLRRVPREMRASWYFGLGSTLIVINMVVATVVFVAAGELSQPVSALLLMLTPMYFLTSLWGSARETAGRLAMLLGIPLGPAFHLVVPEFDLLFAGLLGGSIAYAAHRMRPGRGAP